MKRRRTVFLAVAAATVMLIAGCAPPSTDGQSGPDAFRWYADGCRTAATSAADFYASADSPVTRQVAEKALDALVFSARKVIENVPLDVEQSERLSGLIDSLDARTPLSDLSEGDTETFRRKQKAILHSITEVGEMCRSIFTGFKATQSP